MRAGAPGVAISAAKLSVIGHIFRAGSITPTALAALEGVKLQSLTRLLAELEADHWLKRSAHESDGRQTVLSLTRDGSGRLKEFVRAGELSLARVIQSQLDADEVELMLHACSLLERLGQAMTGEESAVPAAAPAVRAARHAAVPAANSKGRKLLSAHVEQLK